MKKIFAPLFVWGSTWAMPTMAAIVTPIVYGTYAAAVVVGGCYSCVKIADVYAPDRDMPTKKGGEPTPDEDAEGAYTQLGTRKGSNGKYAKGREFNNDGKIVKEVEFTDHDLPINHPYPHQHEYKENGIGGTRSRGKKAEPVPNWRYE